MHVYHAHIYNRNFEKLIKYTGMAVIITYTKKKNEIFYDDNHELPCLKVILYYMKI